MKKTIVLFTVMICFSGISATGNACAYTYDATGGWLFTPDDGQVILNQQVPVFSIEAGIYQTGDSFSIQTYDIIYEGDNLGSFGASGVVNNALYSFAPAFELTADLQDMPGMQVKITLSSFELETEESLYGSFDVFFGSDVGGWADISDLTFSGERTVVPLPAAFWILSSGLVGMVGLRKRFSKGRTLE